MNNLINIKSNGEGKQLVSARELYLGLGLNKSNWSRWYPVNIEKSEFFKENADWVGVRHYDEGNETMDFVITLDFAKHIAMMARTSKSHEYRNYFIKCEEKAKNQKQLSPMEQLRLQYQVIEQHEEKLTNIESKIEKLENTMTIDYAQQEELNSLAKKVVVQALGGYGTPAYKELNKKAFSAIWKDYKRVMQVNSYKNTAVKKLEKGRALLNDWKPNRELELMIKGANSQLSYEEVM